MRWPVYLKLLLIAGVFVVGAAGRANSAHPGGVLPEPGRTPVYRVNLKVHRGRSTLPVVELQNLLEEVNSIWWSQAGVCFEITSSTDETKENDGFDLWFVPEVPDPPRANGVFKGDHDIWSRDFPNLNPAPNPAIYRAARTSAHELGHGLRLQHYDGFPDSPDSLMGSGFLGWRLHDFEINAARIRARQKARPDTTVLNCAPPRM